MSKGNELVLTAEHISKRYSNHLAVKDFSVELRQGQICSLIGHNGAGKSSVLRMLAGIFFPDTGKITSYTNKKIGFLPEERGLYQNMKVQEHLEYLAALRGLSSAKVKLKAGPALEEIGLGPWRNRRVKQLSKGMQQKVQLLATILHEPDLLILDEPFSGLDPVSLNQVCDLLIELRNVGTSILITTHEMHIAERISDALCFLKGGVTLWAGTASDLASYFGKNLYRIGIPPNEALNWPEYVKAKITKQHIGEQINLSGVTKLMEVEFCDGFDPLQTLSEMMQNHRIVKFEKYSPSLEEAFTRLNIHRDGEASAAELLAQINKIAESPELKMIPEAMKELTGLRRPS